MFFTKPYCSGIVICYGAYDDNPHEYRLFINESGITSPIIMHIKVLYWVFLLDSIQVVSLIRAASEDRSGVLELVVRPSGECIGIAVPIHHSHV